MQTVHITSCFLSVFSIEWPAPCGDYLDMAGSERDRDMWMLRAQPEVHLRPTKHGGAAGFETPSAHWTDVSNERS